MTRHCCLATQAEWKHQNASGGSSVHRTLEEAVKARDEWGAHKPYPVDEPPHPPSVGIFRREVTPWVEVDVDGCEVI